MQHGAGRDMPAYKLVVRGVRALHRNANGRHPWDHRARMIAAGVVAALLASAPILGPSSVAPGGWVTAALIAGAVTLAVLAVRRALRSRSTDCLRFVGDQLVLQAGGRADTLIEMSEPMGITLLSNAARDRLLVAVTGRQRLAFLATNIEPHAHRTYRDLLVRAGTVPDDELVGTPFGGGAPLELASDDLAALLSRLAARDPACFERCFLSDTHGRSLVLDGPELTVGHHRFDLHAPLEWRAIVFQEPFGTAVMNENARHPSGAGGVMVYQGTWLQQGSSEVVLVSLLASLTAAASPRSPHPETASLLARDLRLMQAAPEEPPPRDLRVGIERIFMLRMRAAVDRAPRASRTERPSGASMR